MTAPWGRGTGAATSHTHPESDVSALTADLAGKLAAGNNLSDLASAATSRINLGALTRFTTTATKTSAYTAAAGELVPCDATGGSFTVTLPAASTAGQHVAVKLLATSGANTVTVSRAGSDTINNGATTVTVQLADEAAEFTSTGAGVWIVAAGRVTVTSLDARYAQLSTVTTKGDLFVATSASTLVRVGVGADGQVLTGLASATAGVAWARPTATAAADHGLLAWNYDPALVTGSAGSPSSGVMQVMKLNIPYAMTITNIHCITVNSPSGLTAMYGALYDSTGTLYSGSQSADQSSVWNVAGPGLRTIPLGTAKAVSAGWVYVGWWYVGSSTNPTIARASGTSTTHDAGQTNTVNSVSSYSYATGASSLTTAASGSLSTFNQNGLAIWAGVS